MRRTGWLFKPADPRDRSITDELRARAAIPSEKARVTKPLPTPDHTYARAPRGFQRTTSSCFGFAMSRIVYQYLVLNGAIAPAVPSESWMYAAARLQEYAGVDPKKVPPLTDLGCYPAYGLAALRAVGYVSQTVWPFVPSQIDRKPPPKVALMAFPQRNAEYFRVWSSGQSRIDECTAAMKERMSAAIGMRVDDAFCNHMGAEPIRSIDLLHTAGHGMSILKIRDDGCAMVDNWWEIWGMSDGTGWIAPELWTDPTICPDIFFLKGIRLR